MNFYLDISSMAESSEVLDMMELTSPSRGEVLLAFLPPSAASPPLNWSRLLSEADATAPRDGAGSSWLGDGVGLASRLAAYRSRSMLSVVCISEISRLSLAFSFSFLASSVAMLDRRALLAVRVLDSARFSS